MKVSGLFLGLFVASLTSAFAQVTVEVRQDQDQFLQGEALPVAVRITNLSGQSLHLGSESNWLTFSIESRDGFVVPKLSDAPVLGAFVLDSSKVAIKRLDLAPYFTLTHAGRYAIVATVHIRDWNRDITSPPLAFDIIDGAKLWQQEVGVPKPSGTLPEVRNYMLQQANYIRGQLRLYLRVTDAYGRTLRVTPIGPMVSFGQPEPRVDRLSRLHVLYQDGAYTFSYSVFGVDGNLISRQTFDYINTRPRLRMDDDGNISEYGGVRHASPNDFPPPDSAQASSSLQPPIPAMPPGASPGSTNFAAAPKL